MFERSRVNVKFREVLLYRLRGTSYILPLFYLRAWKIPTSSPGRFSLAKARKKRPGDEVLGKNTRQRKSTLTDKLMFIVAINQPIIKNAHRLLNGYESSWEKTILSVYFNSICPYCITYKVVVEESSGERTSREGPYEPYWLVHPQKR